MPRKEAGLSMCGITQDLMPEHWNWTDAEKAYLGNLPKMCEIIENRLKSQFPNLTISECYIILHDKDMKQVWNEASLNMVTIYKTRHIHIYLAFLGVKLMLNEIAAAVGLEPQFVERPKAGRWAKDNMLAYLIHAKNSEKYQYDPNEVYTHRGEPYRGIYEARKETWEKGQAKREKQNHAEDIDWLLKQILTGKITRSEIMLTDAYYAVYAEYSSKCDAAFETYGQRKAYMAIRAMENKEFEVAVFYITGQAGAGKSTFTDMFVNNLIERVFNETGDMWQKCSVASSNPLDDWQGEEILVMDDLRGMAMTASDWLKLLDPERVNRAGTRYKNHFVTPRVIVINAEKDVVDFFYFLKGIGGGNRSEAMDQFIRRIMSRVYVVQDPMTQMRLASVNDAVQLPAGQIMRVPVKDGDMTVAQINVRYAFMADPEHENMTFADAVDYIVERTMTKNKDIRKGAIQNGETGKTNDGGGARSEAECACGGTEAVDEGTETSKGL